MSQHKKGEKCQLFILLTIFQISVVKFSKKITGSKYINRKVFPDDEKYVPNKISNISFAL